MLKQSPLTLAGEGAGAPLLLQVHLSQLTGPINQHRCHFNRDLRVFLRVWIQPR